MKSSAARTASNARQATRPAEKSEPRDPQEYISDLRVRYMQRIVVLEAELHVSRQQVSRLREIVARHPEHAKELENIDRTENPLKPAHRRQESQP